MKKIIRPSYFWAGVLALLLWVGLAVSAASADTTYTVRPGDTLNQIARTHNTTVTAILQANNLTNPNLIYVGQTLTIPTGTGGTPPPAATTTPPPSSGSHTVRPGETLGSISRLYGITVQSLAQANQIVNPNLIYVGQLLTIPGGGTPPATPPPGATPTPPPSSGGSVYVVQAGDTLNRIAVRFGVTTTAIMQANGLTNPNLIYVGQALNIPAGGTNPPPPSGGTLPAGFLFGGQTQSFANPDRMKYAGMGWVKFQYKWSPGDSPDAVAGLIQNGRNQNFKVLISITGAQTYPAANGIDFGSFVTFVRGVASLSTPPDAIEIWNEMNIDFEWPAGQINPISYVQNMLAPSYNAIKAVNPNILVISGAPAPTGFDNGTNAWADNRYIAGLFAAGGISYLDCVGAHFNAGATSPTVNSGHPAGTHYSWYYGLMLQTYSAAVSSRKPICFTELGYLSGDGFPAIPPNFSWASGNSVSEQAQWLAEVVNLAKNSSNVKMVIVFNVDFTHYQTDGDPQAGYGIIRPDGSCPACETLRGVTGGR